MRIAINEFFKVYFNKNLLFVFVGLILLNALLLYVNENDRTSYYSPDAYKQIYSDIENMSSDEALNMLQDENEELNVFLDLSFMSNDRMVSEESLSETYHSLDIPTLIDKFTSGDFLNYTDNLWAEKYLYEHVIEEVKNVNQYANYLEKIDTDANMMQSVSIFAKPNTFPHRNITKTPEDFKHLNGNELAVAPSKGVIMATQFLPTDFIAIILIMVIVIQLITKEKEQQRLGLIKTTYKGRLTLVVSKLSVVICSCFMILILLYSINFSMAIVTYGFGDVGRYIQSVAGYLGSSLGISVLQYLVLFLVAKLFVYILLALIFFTVSIIARTSVMVYISLALLFGISAILYISIPPTSFLAFFKYMNLVHFLHTYTLFSNYLNLNIGGYPFQYIYCFIIIITLLIIIFSVISTLQFCKQRHVSSSLKVTAYIQEKISALKWFRGHKHTSVFRHESYKILVVNRVLLILMAFIMLQFVFYQPEQGKFVDFNDVYYKRYMLQLEGEKSPLKEEFLVEEQQRFDELNDEISMLIQSDDNTMKISELSDLLAPQEAFYQVVEHAEYLRNLEEEDHLKGWFLYDVGYQKLTAGDDNTKDLQLALLFMIVLIVCLAQVFTYETQTGMVHIVTPTKHGRSKAFYSKLFLSLMIGVFIYLIVYAPEFISVLKAYGTRALDAPIYSMPHMSNMKIDLSILQYLWLISIIRLVAMLLAIIVIFVISVRLPSLISVFMAVSGVLVLPLLLALLDINLFDYLLLTPLLSGNILFKEYSFLFLQNNRIVWYVCILISVVLSAWLLYQYFRRKYIRYRK